MKNHLHIHKIKANINFPLLDVKEEFVKQINIQLNNGAYKISYQQSNQLLQENMLPYWILTISPSHIIYYDDDDIKEQVTKYNLYISYTMTPHDEEVDSSD
ncbi:hypothetical protein ACTFIW_003316 [Dictyostelium discoideum]